MISPNHEHFEEIEIEHNRRTYYANGYVEYITTASIGGSYEGYDFEMVYDREICDISIGALWYYDEETGDGVDILGHEACKDIERMAEEVIRYRFE